MEFIQKLFGAENKLPLGGKSAVQFLEYNGELINRVVQEIIDPFLKPSTSTGSNTTEPETDLSYTLKLMDADTCGQMAFFLSKNMTEMIKTYDISGFGGPINTIAPGSKSITEASIQTPNNGMVSRKQICDRLAAHYITILNLIGAILTAINPDTNMALSRMNSLYTLVDGTTDKFLINICQPEGKQVVHTNILDEPGLREFLGLYLYHLLSVSESPADKGRVMQEYQNLVRKLVDEDRTVAMPLEIPDSEPEQANPTQANPTQTNLIPTQVNPTQTNLIPTQVNPTQNNINTKPTKNNMGTGIAATGAIAVGAAAIAAGLAHTNNNSHHNQPSISLNQEKPGIFKVLTDKLSSGLNAILPEPKEQQPQPQLLQQPQPQQQLQQLGNQNGATNTTSSSSSYRNSSSRTSSSGSYTYSDSEREQKQQEINNIADEITAKRAKGIDFNDPAITGLTTKIQTLIGELDAESSSSNSSTDSSYRKWLSYKKRKYGSSSSSTNTTDSNYNQYGGTSEKPLSTDASITRFINFMEKYIHENPADKRTIMRNVLTLFKGGHFKKPDPSRIKTLCSNAKSEGKQITLQIDSNNKYLKAFNDNYLEMRHSYMKSVGELVDILENRILMHNLKTQKMELRNLSSRELADLETRTRTNLAQLYSNAHTQYVQGVNSLYDYYHNLTSGVNVY